MFQDNTSSTMVLASDDLELLQKFLEAWCEENDVDPNSEQAQFIASGLFNWYQFELNDRALMKTEPPGQLPESSELRQLMRQLAAA